jgi:lipopolysaccharide biosynthesis regulator YciM
MHWFLIAIGLAVVAAVLGHRLRRRREQARAYLKGVRSMISDDPDAAIEALSDAARLSSPEAVETYLALGDLFKREGDLTRAIRLHRNMLHRPGLPAGRRAEVERELADDHRRAGMLDDAAEAYRRLMEGGDALAAAGLRDVLVDQQRHAEAVEIQRTRCAPDARLLAHLLAARSREARERGGEDAVAAAREAVLADPGCADAQVALAEALAGAGDEAGAREAIGRALAAAPEAALLAWSALRALAPGAAAAVVEGALGERPGDARLLALRGRLLALSGYAAPALVPLREALAADGDGEVTLSLRELLREAPPPGPGELAGRHDLLAAALLRSAGLLRCRHCGGGAPVRAWRCPRCGTFDAYG